MSIKVGDIFYKNECGKATVRKIIKIFSETAYYETIRGSNSVMKKHQFGNCKIKKFKAWKKISPDINLETLDGAKIWPSVNVLNPKGTLLFVCYLKKAKWYVKKHYAKWIDNQTIQLTNNETEKRIKEIWPVKSDFFFEIKNKKCVVCGVTTNLSRHHVVPQSEKKKISDIERRKISNILFLCRDCHDKYEKIERDIPYINDRQFITAWESHFLQIMKPQYLPKHWRLYLKDIKLQ